jgi:hypothetical protein
MFRVKNRDKQPQFFDKHLSKTRKIQFRILMRSDALCYSDHSSSGVNATAPKLKYIVQHFMLFPMIYRKLGHKLANVKTARINKVLIAFVHRITMRKHLYSVGVYEKSVFPVVPKLEYIMQYFMLFQTIYSRLVHKFINVKTARINKLLIAFVHRITLRKHLYSAGVYAESVCSIVPKLDFVQYFTFFPAMYSKLGHKLTNVEVGRINKC